VNYSEERNWNNCTECLLYADNVTVDTTRLHCCCDVQGNVHRNHSGVSTMLSTVAMKTEQTAISVDLSPVNTVAAWRGNFNRQLTFNSLFVVLLSHFMLAPLYIDSSYVLSTFFTQNEHEYE